MKKGWRERAVGEILQLEYGKPLDKSDRKPNGRFPVYGANGVKDRTDKFYHDRPSIIVGRKGSAGEINLTEEKFWPLDVTYFVTFDEQQHDLRFLYYLLTTLELTKLARGVKPGINRNEVYSQVTKAPPLSEQRRIVGILDEVFEGIATAKANAEKDLQNARALFESHLNAVFTQRGEGWVARSLADVCIVDWGNTDLTKSSYVKGGEFLAVSAAGCDGRIGHKEHAKHTPVLSAIGAQCGRMFFPEEDFTAIKNTITLTPLDGKCTGKFLYRLLTHVKLPKRGAAQPFIAKGDILAFQVVVPDTLAVQQRIEESLSELETETQRLESIYLRKLDALDELKKSLLHQAFNGKL